MHAGLNAEALRGCAHFRGWVGGENLWGGEEAKGIPRNLLTVAVAEGMDVVVPMMTPEAIVASAGQSTALARLERARSPAQTRVIESIVIL